MSTMSCEKKKKKDRFCFTYMSDWGTLYSTHVQLTTSSLERGHNPAEFFLLNLGWLRLQKYGPLQM